MKTIYFVFSILVLTAELLISQVSFTDVAPALGLNDPGAAQGVIFADINNDGFLDIILLNNNTANKLWINNNGTSFTESSSAWNYQSLMPGRGLTCGDYNNDGNLDFVVGNWQSSILLYKNLGTSFSEVSAAAGVNWISYGGAINWLDYNNDGKLDFVLCNNGVPARYSFLFKNNDLSTFTHATFLAGMTDSTSVLSCASGDYDNDGDLDVLWGTQMIQGTDGTSVLYKNNGNGTFTNVTAAAQFFVNYYSWGVHWGDYNNDGFLDAAIANSNGASYIFKNNGNGTFSNATFALGVDVSTSSYSCGWADYDNDGDLDIYFSRGVNQADKLYRNDGTTFTDVSAASGMGDLLHSSCISWGDYNNDGFLDLYLNNNGSTNRLYKNNAGNSNKWLILKLTGTNTNRSAIGTRVTAITGSLRQIREVEGGSGGKGQNSLPVEFGFGTASIIDTLKVRWYSGLTQTFTNVTPNRIISLTEGGTLGIENSVSLLPDNFKLYQNYPNPFNPVTKIKFDIKKSENGTRNAAVKLIVFDVTGREIAMLVNGILQPGTYEYTFDGTNLTSGLYFYKLTEGGFTETRKMILLK
ncbi:MAG: FG-GAP-like repeat-containing protein [Ignavibacteria bacterium]|nr:FG-GAP-like repeat-containing protein [Ignavibacteria bacterium]